MGERDDLRQRETARGVPRLDGMSHQHPHSLPGQPDQPPAYGQPVPPGHQQPGYGPPAQVNHTYIVRDQKNTVLTYVLWFFLGSLGIHKFYLGHYKAGITYLLLSVIGWATTWLLIGFAFLAVVGVLLIVDIFLIPGHVRQANALPPEVRR